MNWKRIIIIVIAVWLMVALIVVACGTITTDDADAQAPDGDPNGEIVSKVTWSTGLYWLTADGRCIERKRIKKYKNVLGQTMVWTRLTKYWCINSKQRITYAPKATMEAYVTTLGGLLQWEDKGLVDSVERWFMWGPAGLRGGHYSWRSWHFIRCVPTPFGCIKIEDRTVTNSVHAFGDGHSTN